MSDYLNRDPGIYEADGNAFALVEQQRASIIDALRTAKAASVTILEPDGSGTHWGIFLMEDGDAESFLVYAAARALIDAAAALGTSTLAASGLVMAAIDLGGLSGYGRSDEL